MRIMILRILHIAILLLASSFYIQVLGQEICDNRIDDDGDGLIDCFDPDCNGSDSCWDCYTEFYQVHSNTYLVALNPATGTYSTLGTISGASAINGLQFNHVDGHVYAPCIINGEHKLGVLSQDGSVTDTGLALPGSIFYVGSITENGVMYVSNSGGIYSIDLNQPTLTIQATGASNPGVADFALDLNNGLMYGINSSSQLKVFNPSNNSISTYDLAGSINTESGGFGAAWSSNDGSFFAYNNSSGKIYSVNVNDLTATLVLNGTGNLSINDGFNCVLAPPPFETNCSNGIDDDGDGLVDCDDPDCYNSNNCLLEICDNGIDDDGDGLVDCDDTECYSLQGCTEICDNGIDDNNNGLIDGDDPQCGGTTGGINGGLESNGRLSDQLAYRNYIRETKSKQTIAQIDEGLIPFASVDFREEFSVADFIPQAFDDIYIAQSSPEDLIGITNATEVVAADYYRNDIRIGSVLGIESENGVYEHTKYICDRLENANLIDVSYMWCSGGRFISYELLAESGNIEYAVSFSARIEDDKMTLESHWGLDQYPESNEYYNFQVWASSYEDLIMLLENGIANIETFYEISEINNSSLPMVFITNAKYANGELVLNIKNKNLTQEVRFDGLYRASETGVLEVFDMDLPLTGQKEQIVTLPIGGIYDIGLEMDCDNCQTDQIFLADGTWGVEDNHEGVFLQDFTIVPENRDAVSEEEYRVDRSVELEASVKDYVNIFRSLDPKFKPQNLQQHNALTFQGSGSGYLEVTLVKSSIIDWADQFRTTVVLYNEERNYELTVNQFVSETYDELVLSDISMIVFSVLGNNSTYEQKTISLSDLSFKTVEVVSNSEDIEIETEALVSPNPTSGGLLVQLSQSNTSIQTFLIYDGQGSEVLKADGFNKQTRSIEVNVSNYCPGMYRYQIITLDGRTLDGSFVKI